MKEIKKREPKVRTYDSKENNNLGYADAWDYLNPEDPATLSDDDLRGLGLDCDD